VGEKMRERKREEVEQIMKNRIVEFLKQYDLDFDWNDFFIDHVYPKSNRTLSKIKNFYGERRGVYIYLDEKDHCLYIGIGKLKDRVKFHYLEGLGLFSGKGCEKHIKFFTQHPGTLKVLWTVVEDRGQQLYIEKILTDEFKPAYEVMKKEGLLK
jgi:hypothetical protein